MTRAIDQAFAAGLLALAAYIVWSALAYGYMRDAVPGPGFFPFWIGLGLIGLSAANILRSLTGREVLDSRIDAVSLAKTGAIIALVIAFILTAPWIGMVAGSGALVVAVAFVVRPRWTVRFAVAMAGIALAFSLVSYLLFGIYLRVPLVRGVFGF